MGIVKEGDWLKTLVSFHKNIEANHGYDIYAACISDILKMPKSIQDKCQDYLQTFILPKENGGFELRFHEKRIKKVFRESQKSLGRRLAETSPNSEVQPVSWIAPALIICAIFLALLCCYLFFKRQKRQA